MTIQKKLSGSAFAPLQVTNVIGDNDPGETALGSSAGTAFSIGACNTYFTTVAASTGAILPPGNTGGANTNALGDEYMVVNLGANALTVYPPAGGTVNGGASASIATNSLAYFTCCSTNGLTWISK